MHVFSILHVQVGDFGRTSGSPWLSVLLSPDYFTFLYLFIYIYIFAPIGEKKITFIFPLTYKITAESMSLKSKTKKSTFK